MKKFLKTFIYGVIVILYAGMAVIGIVSSIYLFIHIADVTGWSSVLRFICTSFDLIISIFIIFVLGWVARNGNIMINKCKRVKNELEVEE